MASNGVNVKMGVSGIAQFKQGMKQAQQSVKVLDAELALNEKQYKATGDAESYMETKAELLKKKLEEQKTAVANAEKALQDMNSNGVDKATTAYQNMQIALAKAKGDLTDTETALDNIYSAAADADTGVSDMNTSLTNIGKNLSYENVTSALGSITGAMSTVMSKAYQLGAALVRNTLGAGEWADELLTTAKVWDIDAEELQRMRKTADIIDTDAETILAAKQKLNKNLGNNNKAAAEALNDLFGDTIVSTNAEDRFWQIGEAIMNMGDEMEQESSAQALFGKSWRELIPLFSAGREEYEKLNESWHVVPQESIDKLGEMDDQYQKLQNEIETVKNEFLSDLAPTITKVMETMTGMVSKFNDYLASENGQEMMEALSTAVSSLFDDLTKVDPDKVMESVIGAINQIKSGLNWIKTNKKGVVTAVEAFVGAWAALKTAQGVTTVLQLVNGVSSFGKAGMAANAAAAGSTAGQAWGASFGATAGKAILAAAPWLVGLYTLLKPSAGSDETGNNTIVDENGQLTTEGEKYGYKLDENGEAYKERQGRWINLETGEHVDAPALEEEEDTDLGYGHYSREQMEEAIQDWWDATQNANRGEDSLSEADAAQAWMEEVLGENFGDVWAEIVEKLDEVNQSKLDDIPTDWYSNILDAVVGDDNDTASGLNAIPGRLASAVTSALAGVRVEIDGQAAGNILAPYVSENMGNILAALIKYGT